jgi:hypothetical protein
MSVGIGFSLDPTAAHMAMIARPKRHIEIKNARRALFNMVIESRDFVR